MLDYRFTLNHFGLYVVHNPILLSFLPLPVSLFLQIKAAEWVSNRTSLSIMKPRTTELVQFQDNQDHQDHLDQQCPTVLCSGNVSNIIAVRYGDIDPRTYQNLKLNSIGFSKTSLNSDVNNVYKLVLSSLSLSHRPPRSSLKDAVS